MWDLVSLVRGSVGLLPEGIFGFGQSQQPMALSQAAVCHMQTSGFLHTGQKHAHRILAAAI